MRLKRARLVPTVAVTEGLFTEVLDFDADAFDGGTCPILGTKEETREVL